MARAHKLGIAVVALVLAATAVVVASALLTPGKEPVPIAGKPFAGTPFVRYPVTPRPLTGFAAQQILHPFMAFEGGGLHGNAYNSDVHVTGVEPGRYDAKVSYRASRQCFVRDIEFKADAVFSISDKDLKDCST